MFAPDTGKVERVYDTGLVESKVPHSPYRGYAGLPPDALILRTPVSPLVEYCNGRYTLLLSRYSIKESRPCPFAGRRQEDFRFMASARMTFLPSGEEEAGLVIYYSQDRYYLLSKRVRNGRGVLEVSSPDRILASEEIPDGIIELGLVADVLVYKVNGEWRGIGGCLDGRLLSAFEGGYTGSFIALYASSNGKASQGKAVIEDFTYSGIK